MADAEARPTLPSGEWLQVGTGESGTGCLITSAVPGRPAQDLPASAWPGVLDTFARTLRDLHALPAASCPFSREDETTATPACRTS